MLIMTIITIITVTDMVWQMCKSNTHYNVQIKGGTRGINYEDDQTDVVVIYVEMYIWTLEPEELEEFGSKVHNLQAIQCHQ